MRVRTNALEADFAVVCLVVAEIFRQRYSCSQYGSRRPKAESSLVSPRYSLTTRPLCPWPSFLYQDYESLEELEE